MTQMETVIVNPAANKGRSGALLPEITSHLQSLGIQFEVLQTEAPKQATTLTRQSVNNGAKRIIAVGGDGTCCEVVNGLLIAADGRPTIDLGIIPTGSGNDLAYCLGIPFDIPRACSLLTNGRRRSIDAGRVIVDSHRHFFVNNVGLGLDAEVALATRKSMLLQGFLMYLKCALGVVAFGKWPYEATFSFNGKQYRQTITLLSIGNGRRSGGGFFLTPEAEFDDGLLDICFAPGLSRLKALHLLPKTMKGTHIQDRVVTQDRTRHIEILIESGIPGHMDGEVLCESGKHFIVDMLPKALQVWV